MQTVTSSKGMWTAYDNVISVGDHLAECRCVALGQVSFMKIRNLVHFADLGGNYYHQIFSHKIDQLLFAKNLFFNFYEVRKIIIENDTLAIV